MPVLDHAVHPSTQHGADFKYGCNAVRPQPQGYYVMVREYHGDGRYALLPKLVEHAMSVACRYMDHATDPGCRDCQQSKDHTYINQMKELK